MNLNLSNHISVAEQIIDGSITIDSIEEFKSILKIFPNDPALQKAFSNLLRKEKRAEEAAKSFEATVKQLFEQTGFEFIRRSCFLGAKGTFQLSLNQLMDNKQSPTMNKLYPILSAFLWPYRKIAYLLDRGPIITFAGGKID